MKSNNVSPPDKEKAAAAAGVLGYPPKQPLNINPPPRHHQYPPAAGNYPLHAYAPPHPYPAGGHPGVLYPPNQYPSPTPNLPSHHSHPGYNKNYASTPLRPSPPPHVLEYEARRSFAFARVILCLMVFLILMTSVMSLLTYIVFGSDIPTFEVATFAVPSFNITAAAAGNSTLTAAFEGSVAAENPNHKLDITFQHVEVGVGYRQLAVVAKKQIEPFELKKDASLVLKTSPLSTPAGGFGDAGGIWLNDMKSEYDRNRSVTFDLMLTVVATFKSGSSWSRRTIFKVVCAGLKTEFKDPGGAGVWDGVKPACMVFG